MAKSKLEPLDAVDGLMVEIEGIYRKKARRIFTKIIERTPWEQPEYADDGGTAKNSWCAGSGEVEAVIRAPNPWGYGALDSVEAALREWKTRSGIPIAMSNVVPYINNLEYGYYQEGPRVGVGGWSTQAPNGMVGVTFSEEDSMDFTDEGEE